MIDGDLFIRCYSSSKIFRTYQALTLRVHIHESEEEELAIVNIFLSWRTQTFLHSSTELIVYWLNATDVVHNIHLVHCTPITIDDSKKKEKKLLNRKHTMFHLLWYIVLDQSNLLVCHKDIIKLNIRHI